MKKLIAFVGFALVVVAAFMVLAPQSLHAEEYCEVMIYCNNYGYYCSNSHGEGCTQWCELV